MTSHSESSDDPSRAGRRDGEGVLTERRIPASIPDVAHSLVMLERPAAVTENRVVRVTQIGAYAAPSAPGGPFRVDRGWISVRIDSDAVSGAFLVDPGAGRVGAVLPELRLHGPGGLPAHRCHALQDGDRLVLEGLSASTARRRRHPRPVRNMTVLGGGSATSCPTSSSASTSSSPARPVMSPACRTATSCPVRCSPC